MSAHVPARTTARIAALMTAAALLAGCGTSAGTSAAGSADPASATASQQASQDPAGEQLVTHERPVAEAPDDASMVCSDELRASIAKVLHVSSVPRGHATWDGTLFTCRYDLSAGPLVLTVHQSSDKQAAQGYFQQRKQAAGGRTITGLQSLGLPAFQDRAGTVGFVKDDFTLLVDASKLSGTLGSPDTSQTDFAYTVATDVLACWSH